MNGPGTPSFDQLRIFLAVVDRGSFAGAGRQLNRAVSVISYGIANLEDLQGVTGSITYKGTIGMPLRSVSVVRITAGNRELVAQGQPDPADIPAP